MLRSLPYIAACPLFPITCNHKTLPAKHLSRNTLIHFFFFPHLQPSSRRLPPGWTPFREAMKDPVHASIAPVKEESSEEDTTSASPTAPTAEGANDKPFHCPSKPWKEFHPAHPAPPAPDGTAAPPPTSRPLRDEDLLA